MGLDEADTSVVRLRRVSKLFTNGTLALDGIDLAIQSGQFVSLLGPSGCGKSTALRLIAGLGDATSGVVDWPGLSLTKGGKPVGSVGFIFQEPTLMPWRTAAENVYLPLQLAGVSRAAAKARVDAALAQVNLSKFAESYPRELSGGMKMRVSIARALVTGPKLLLMDEPFAALDEISRQKLNDDVLTLWRNTGVTVVFVTHSAFEAAYLSNRIVVMSAHPGRIHADFGLNTSSERDAFYRTSENFRAACDQVSHALHDAMGLGGSKK